MTRQLCGQGDQLILLAAQSRRDDLEALGYMLVYFLRGKLPWQGLKAKRGAKYLLVLEMKQATSASELCAGLPAPFEKYMRYVHNLHDGDLPDYRGLRKMFDKTFSEQGFERDNVFDWTIREFQRLESVAQQPPASKVAYDEQGAATVPSPEHGIPEVPQRSRRKRR